MDPVSLIVAALVQGLLAGVSSVAESMVTDTYTELREGLLRRSTPDERPRVDGALRHLERDPNDAAAQQWVVEEIRRAGLADDPVLQTRADRILQLIEAPRRSGAQRVESTLRTAGGRAVAAVLDRHVGSVLRLRASEQLEDPELLSPEAGSRQRVPRPVADEVARLHADVRRIIHDVAARIETANADPAAVDGGTPLSRAHRDRAERLAAADRDVRVSYQALRSTIDYFAVVNRSVVERIDRAGNAGQEVTRLLGNAVMIYEVTNFVIDYIDRFAIAGEPELRRLRDETFARLDGLQQERARLQRKVADPEVEPAVRDRILADLADGDELDAVVRGEWETYLGEIELMRSYVGEAARKRTTLEAIRDHARLHIGTMQEVAMLRFLRSNSEAVSQTVLTLESFVLPQLSPSRVRRLIAE